MTGLVDAIRALVHERGISEELILKIIRDFLLVAYKKTYGTDENAIVQFTDDNTNVNLYAEKRIVDEVEDPVYEISLQDALESDGDITLGDKLQIEIPPTSFNRIAIQSAKQRAQQSMREVKQDILYSEYINKVGEIINGYCQRERNGNIYVDLGNTEGILPRQFRSSREPFRQNTRIKVLVHEVTKHDNVLQITLSRVHSDFVRRIFEHEIPELYDRSIEIKKIVREPGYRTKIVVETKREEIDPVGACVGVKGVRILSIIKELEGEKIDVIRYRPLPQDFIKDALAPAEVSKILILDENKRQALAVVPENQLSISIGKMGMNVRLANRLTDWNIDVKTSEQFAEMDMTTEMRHALESLFVQNEEITEISELSDIPREILQILNKNNITTIEQLLSLDKTALLALNGIDTELADAILKIVEDEIEVVEQAEVQLEEDAIESEEETQDELMEETTETMEEESLDDVSVAEEEMQEDEDVPDVDAEEYIEIEEESSKDEEILEDDDVVEANEDEVMDELEEEMEMEEDENDESDDISIRELPDIAENVIIALENTGITSILQLMGTADEILRDEVGITPDEIAILRNVIEENVSVMEDDEE